MISNKHIDQIAKFEALLINEMYLERQEYLVPAHNYKWFGKQGILDLGLRHKHERANNFESIKTQYPSIDPQLFLEEYVTADYSYSSVCAALLKYSSAKELSAIEAQKFEIAKKFIDAFRSYYEIYKDETADIIKDELDKLNGRETTIDHFDSELKCSICLCDTKNSNRITNCRHYFHLECISHWQKQINTCPNCRTDISQLIYVKIDIV
jgi:hypothetical protein